MVARKGPHAHLVPIYDTLSTADLADGVHLTEDGYREVAAAWYDALQAVPGALVPTSMRAARVEP
ncbi:hypothetical protein [Streptomyces sp. NPDC002851]